MRAMRVDSGWKIDEPMPISMAPISSMRIAAGVRQHDQADQRAAHAGDQRIGLRPAVGVHADHGLEQRRGQLKRQRDQADLAEVEAVGVLDDGIDGRQQRLHHVVQQMREAERENDRRSGFRGRAEAAWGFGRALTSASNFLEGLRHSAASFTTCSRPDWPTGVRRALADGTQ